MFQTIEEDPNQNQLLLFLKLLTVYDGFIFSFSMQITEVVNVSNH